MDQQMKASCLGPRMTRQRALCSILYLPSVLIVCRCHSVRVTHQQYAKTYSGKIASFHVHLRTIWTYRDTGKSDLQLDIALATVAASLWLNGPQFGPLGNQSVFTTVAAFQGHVIAFATFWLPTSKVNGANWILLNDYMIHWTTVVICSITVARKGCKIRLDSLNNWKCCSKSGHK